VIIVERKRAWVCTSEQQVKLLASRGFGVAHDMRQSAPAGKRGVFLFSHYSGCGVFDVILKGPKTRTTSKPKRASLESGAHIRPPPAKGGVRLATALFLWTARGSLRVPKISPCRSRHTHREPHI